MKNRTLYLLLMAFAAFITLAPIMGCTPKKDGDLIKHCDNQVKDEDETGIDCGGSCNPCVEPCDTVVCQNSGTCNNGNCNCPAGYSGNRCQNEVRQAYLGNYNATYTWVVNPGGQTGTNNIQIFIGVPSNGGATGVLIRPGIWGVDIVGILQSNNTSFTISPQVSQGYRYTGNGSFTVNGGTTALNLTLNETYVSSPDTTYTYTFTGQK